ncbi:hypothetical protein [Virgibacillus pantothenticus]|nr:hypothetical protein [Virgibacillus pantothenticus]
MVRYSVRKAGKPLVKKGSSKSVESKVGKFLEINHKRNVDLSGS